MHPVAPSDGDSAQRSAPETLAQWAGSLRAFHFEVASRAALAVALPLIILFLTDHLDWAAYAAGTVWSLVQAGHAFTGADLVVESALPSGAGLSSSAALTCGIASAA